MKNLFILILFVAAISGCEMVEEPTVVEDNVESQSITLIMNDQEPIIFESNDQLLNYLEGTEYYEDLKSKINLLESESKYIEENQLYEKDIDSPIVQEYFNTLSNKLGQSRLAAGCYFYDGFNQSGERIFNAMIARAVLGKRLRNRASSYRFYAAGPVVLCEKTWFRGSRQVLVGIPGTKGNLPNFNNRTSSVM